MKKNYKLLLFLCLLLTISFTEICFAADSGKYVPEKVCTFTAEQEGSCVYFQWKPVKYAVEYHLYSKTGNGNDELLESINDCSWGYAFGTQNAKANGLKIYELGTNKTATFYVKAVTALNVEGEASNIVSVTLNGNSDVTVNTSEIISNKKFEVTNAKASMTSLTIKWNNCPNTQKYIIHQASSKYGTYKEIAETSKAKYVIKGLKKNKTYYFKVEAVKKDGSSEFSNITKKSRVKGNYKKGSVYGPYLNQAKLNSVGNAVADFVNTAVQDNLSDADKAAIAHYYLAALCIYGTCDDYNNAYGALIEQYAECSGYARAYKALCDGLSVKCLYVHSSKSDHQFNIVELDGKPYIVDVQLDSLSGVATGLFRSTSEYKKISAYSKKYASSTIYNTKKYPVCKRDYFEKSYYQERDARWNVSYDLDGLWWN